MAAIFIFQNVGRLMYPRWLTMNSSPKLVPEPTSVPGDFYVENQCCTSCGVPQAVAPDLVGWVDEEKSHCFWKKQPETQAELEHAFAIFDGQELGCHRYASYDPAIQTRIGIENCDYPAGNLFQRLWWRFRRRYS